MQKFQYIITSSEGLHARPAGLLVNFAKGCTSDINLVAREKTANAKRLFAVMGLNIKENDEVVFELNGQEENRDCAELKKFCEANL